MQAEQLKNTLDAILVTAEEPLPLDKLVLYFQPEDAVNRNDIKSALNALDIETRNRGFELKETASGYRYTTREAYKKWVTRHWEAKPKTYSRALLETLALIVYRQPITRAEIEEIRGVAVSSNIVKTLQEREWIRIVGHKEVPGRPAMLGTTRQFLDYFNLKSLDEMPPLADIQDIDKLYPELDFKTNSDAQEDETDDESLPIEEALNITPNDDSETIDLLDASKVDKYESAETDQEQTNSE
ncbi:MAG TPA: SMC-Scp complex subunit ScpB [Thiothrix sp.]|nr:SMC-Scp complex subunit ScpB [Thiothrix sp.]